MENHMTVTFDAISENEAFARMVVSAFMVGANPTVGEMDDVKTAVSEAVTNAVIHGYDKKTGNVMMRCSMKEKSGRPSVCRILVRGSWISKRQGNPFIRPNRNWSGRAWVLLSWKPLWIAWM